MLIYQIVVTLLLLNFVFLVARNLRDYAILPPDLTPPRPGERLFVLIPARNEAENIGECLQGLLAQSSYAWPVPFTLLVLDDGSDDGTDRIVLEMAEGDARVELLRGEPIEAGWAGKVWACRQLGETALNRGADWLLFLDADTRARPELLPALLAYGQTTRADMVSTFPWQVTGTFWERVVLPMLHFLILTFLPVRMVWESKFPQLVAACGQVELFTAEAYRTVGGHGSIPHSFHDGLQLARRVKGVGRTVRLCDASALISCRMYAGGRAVWNGFTRNAYEGLGGIVPLIVMSGLQTMLFLLPFVWLILGVGGWVFRCSSVPVFGNEKTLSPFSFFLSPAYTLILVQIGLILLIRGMQARRFGHGGSIWLHPLSIAALVAIQWASFWKTLRKSHVAWKGRVYFGCTLLCVLLTGAGCGRKADPPIEITGKVAQLYPTGINNVGAMVGSVRFPDQYPSFLLENGRQRELMVPPEAAWVYPLAINDAGEIVGYASRRDNGSRHALLWQNGRPVWLADENAVSSEARALNNQDVIVGIRTLPDGTTRAVQWRNGKMQDLMPAGSPAWRPNGVNVQGEIVGWGIDTSNRPHLYLWRHNRLSDLGAGYHIALNNRGQLAGDFQTADGRLHACMWNGLNRKELPLPPGTTASRAYSINDRGQVVGSADAPNSPASADNAPVPLLWDNNRVLDLNTLRPPGADYVLEEAVAINNNGQILCTARRGKWGRAALLTPTATGWNIRVQ